MTYTTDYVPALVHALRLCLDALTKPQMDIDSYRLAEIEAVDEGEALLKKIEREIGAGYLTQLNPDKIDDEKPDRA